MYRQVHSLSKDLREYEMHVINRVQKPCLSFCKYRRGQIMRCVKCKTSLKHFS